MKCLTIAHLYPDDMNVYGDSGNIVALQKRLQWRGYGCEVLAVQPGQAFDFSSADIVFGGGGQDSGQRRIGSDLAARGAEIRSAVADGLPMLLVCGLYQLFGRGFHTETGHHIDGIGVFQASTVGSATRLVGNIAISSPFGTLVGFENHSGQTSLLHGQQPLGQVLHGWGNNDHTDSEGAITGNAIGTYLHGPLLPKNPALTDQLILSALRRRNLAQELEPLDDDLEIAAAAAAARRPARMRNDMVASRSARSTSRRGEDLRARLFPGSTGQRGPAGCSAAS